jgi:hypothetical protein
MSSATVLPVVLTMGETGGTAENSELTIEDGWPIKSLQHQTGAKYYAAALLPSCA